MNKNNYGRYSIAFIVLLSLLLFFFIWNINAGSIDLSVKEIFHILN